MKTGLLLVNLGTPSAPTPELVGAYLREFLMDPLVIDIPAPLRWLTVNALIVPRRKHASAALYQKIWSEAGSPLLVHHLELTQKVQRALGERAVVRAAMRYGEPSILAAVRELQAEEVDRLVVFPLYPQYSTAATLSSIEKVQWALARCQFSPELVVIPPFYSEAAYLDAVVAVSAPVLAERPYDVALFSFHGLPERQLRKHDPAGHCFSSESCCDRVDLANRHCYRAQSFATARALAERLGIPAGRYRVCFQSRLGRTPWIRPYTDELYRRLPGEGVKRLAILCPSFVSDCLETLEEVRLRGKEEFLRHGGEELYLVPSLNAHDAWVQAVVELASPRMA